MSEHKKSQPPLEAETKKDGDVLDAKEESGDEQRSIRLGKLEQLRKQGFDYPNDFKPQARAANLHQQHLDDDKQQLEQLQINTSVAGRVMLRRQMGKKVVFISVRDSSGDIQLYLRQDILAQEDFDQLQLLDLGDIIAAEGKLFRTNTGELTIEVKNWQMLVKTLRPLPDKYHGLTDPELRHRKRYLSLLSSTAEREVFQLRSEVIHFLRNYLHQLGYLEVETPILQSIPGGAVARPFVTHMQSLGCDFYLRIAQELYLKRLLVGGYERVFELNRNFRNEGLSVRHNPEFTMLEYNAAYHNGEDFMQLTEEMIHALVLSLKGKAQIVYGDLTLDFSLPFARRSIVQVLLEADKRLTPENVADVELLKQILREHGQDPSGSDCYNLQLELFEQIGEQLLIQPTFVTDHPAALSPLSKPRADNPQIADRFECFIAGRELVNGFSELNDPIDQAEKFAAQATLRSSGDLEAMYYDSDYIEALEYGLPPNAGGGIGIDRLVMLLADRHSIRDVILFPQLRPAASSD